MKCFKSAKKITLFSCLILNMSNTLYIDANRANSSIQSSDSNNEWTYKLSESIQLPAGTEIAISDTFIHKQGISGSTIEIDEDIEEEISFSTYLSDNPHNVPQSQFHYDNRSANGITKNKTFKPSFCPFGPLNRNAVLNNENSAVYTGDELNADELINSAVLENPHNSGSYYAETSWSQRVSLFEDDGKTNPRLATNEFANIVDPYLSGYTECPMMAIYVSDDTYTNTVGDATFGGQPSYYRYIPTRFKI